MLLANSGATPRRAVTAGECPGLAAVWLDLLDPSEEERAATAALAGLRVPAQAEIVEIERSSRLRVEGEALYLSMPVTAPAGDGGRVLASLGFVLSPRHLLTLRTSALPVFDLYADALAAGPARTSGEVFVGLLEAIVDRLADVLEQAAADLATLSRRVFHTDAAPRTHRDEDLVLRATLRRIGLAGDLVSNLRDSLLGIGRIVPYVADTANWLAENLKPRLKTLAQDIASLSEYDTRLSDKVQFLLDATLGFLNIEQNNGIKVLTVVSVVGIPPTLIASIYGMNFKGMPELGWTWGYPYGLTMIGLSIVVPLIWFRMKRWL